MDNLITRSDMKIKLKEYVSGKITLKNLQSWELEMSRKDFEVDDWDGDESFTNEVMHEIDMSDIDGFSVEKTKKIIKLLELNENTEILIKKLCALK